MKRCIILLLMISMISLIFFVYNTSDSEVIEVNQSHTEDRTERIVNYLQQKVEDEFMSEEYIESAEAIIHYDIELEQYSIKLSLIATEEIDKERIELYLDILEKSYTDILLIINGKVI